MNKASGTKSNAANMIRITTAVILVAGAFAAGFQLALQLSKQTTAAEHDNPRPTSGTGSTPAIVRTTFVSLPTNIVSMPVARKGQSGGLTSVGNELLLLTYSGETFAVSNTAKKFSIALPDNASRSYESAESSAKYKHLKRKASYATTTYCISRSTPRAISPSRIRTGVINMSVTTPA